MEISDNQKPSSALIALKWGTIVAVLNFLLTVIMKLSGIVDQFDETLGWISTILSTVFVISVLVFAMREYRAANQDSMSFGTGFGLAALIGAISGLVSGAFNYVYLTFIDNGSVTLQLEKAREKMEESGLSESQIQDAEKITKMMLSPGIQFVLVVIMSVIITILLGLIVSLVIKKEKSIFE
ncbi:MAG: DUF4199 domain-containing protein [Aquirufa sp.]